MTTPEIMCDLYKELTSGAKPANQGLLLILMGLPYSGKSTVSALLQEKGFVHVWATVIKKQYGIKDEEMLNVALSVTEKLLATGYLVAFDFLNHTNALRSPFVKLAEKVGCEYRVVFIDTDKQLLLERQEKVAREGGSEGRSAISKEVIEIISRELEVPSSGNHLIEVKNGNTGQLEDWLNCYFNSSV